MCALFGMVPAVRVGTHKFLVAPGAQELASRDGADGETKAREANRKGYFPKTFSQKEEWHGYHTSIKNGLGHLHRQMGHPRFCFR